MTSGQAKKIVLAMFRLKVVVCEFGPGRYFIGTQRGSDIVNVEDAMYFTNYDEAKEMAKFLGKEVNTGRISL